MLYIVPTPIGNLKDITYRAIAVLQQVDMILAEDTRVAGKLLKHYDINTPLQSFHTHNEHTKTKYYIEELRQEKDVALISDAGTPGISDPGYLIIHACKEAGLPITVLPGPTALIPALVASGLPSDRFHFEGFLPRKKGRQTRLQFLAEYPHSIVLYESPFRVEKTLLDIQRYLPGRKVSISRELSKLHEEVITGELEEVLAYVKSDMVVKGEFVLIVGPVLS